MNFDDETLLSAYLDNELDEAQRLRVEESVLADPLLAQLLHDLAWVRDLVAGLGRPAPAFDLSAPVLNWIGDRRPALPLRQRWAGHRAVRPRRLVVASGLTAAAGVLIAATLTLLIGPGKPVHSPPQPASNLSSFVPNGPAIRPTLTDGAASAVADSLAVTPPAARSPEAGAPPSATTAPAAIAKLGAAEQAEEDDRQFLRTLLGRPGVRRILIGVDVIDDAAGQVGEILQQTGRKHPRFGRLAIGQGIALDTDRPGRAVVFAFVADDPERQILVSSIQSRLGDGADIEDAERPLDVRLTTQLAQVRPIEVLEGSLAGSLRSGHEELKIALKGQRDEVVPPINLADTPAVPDLRVARGSAPPTGEPARSRAGRTAALEALGRKEDPPIPGPDEARRDAAADRPARREPVTVLVWVTARDRTRAPLLR